MSLSISFLAVAEVVSVTFISFALSAVYASKLILRQNTVSFVSFGTLFKPRSIAIKYLPSY